MAAYSQDFQNKSNDLLGYVQSQLSQVIGWNALPGQLNKIVASSGGYVWGFNLAGTFFTCREPCDGTNWSRIASPDGIIGMPLDIAVDGQNVYTLFNVKATPQVSSENLPSIQTGQISIGDVGMPPGHISLASDSVIISAVFLGPNASSVQQAIENGKSYTAIINDDQGNTATFPVSSVSTNPAWQGKPWMYRFYGNGGDIGSLTTKFARSKTLSLKLNGAPAVQSANTSSTGLSFAMQPVDGSGRWTVIPVPGSVPANPTINVTDQFIFVGNQGCAKPCTTGNWVPITSPQGSTGVVAASSASTYATVSNNGVTNVYTGSGSAQGGWTPQKGLAGKTPIAVEADNQFLYAKDQGSGNIYRCSAPYSELDSCKPTDTHGTSVSGNHTISVNPRSYQTYIAASSNGSTGNLYQRLDEGSVNVAPILENTQNYASGMDSDVNALGDATIAQVSALSAAQQRQEAVSAIKQVTDLRDKFRETQSKADIIKSKIVNDKPLNTVNRLLPLQIIAIFLGVIIILHFILSFFLSPNIVMGITVFLGLVGVYVAYRYVGFSLNVSFVL